MNRLKFAVILLLGLSMAMMASCTKDSDNSGNGNSNGGGNNGNIYNGHEYVDLGLPSGTLWATCNVGATTPEDCGDLFAWGETTPKTSYTWDNYRYCVLDPNDSYSCKMTKYCCFTEDGYNGFTDNLTTLEAVDDAASANWGEGWRMPTKEQWEELLRFTTPQVSFQNNVQGFTLTGVNHNSIFLPNPLEDPWFGAAYYWSNALKYDPDGYHSSIGAIDVELGNQISEYCIDGCHRRDGLLVRPVRSTH